MNDENTGNSIFFKDRLYGKNEIKSPAIIILINSAPVQRLKLINQFGIPDEFYHLKNYSRYVHSIGVLLLLKKLGASEEEQIAGLLHDVSHTAFSHVYDWIMDDYTQQGNKEDKQDKGHKDFIRNSEIPHILRRYGYSVDRITDYHHFGLLERDSPDLCADRIDYSLREFSAETAGKILDGLTVFDGQIVCRDYQTAALYGRAFLNLQQEHWGGYEAVVRYHLFAKTLRTALKAGIVSADDFLLHDEHIISRLKASGNTKILVGLEFLKQRTIPPAKSGVVVYKKFRYIDPLYLARTSLIRLSEKDGEFRELLNNARRGNKEGVLVPK
ncbi:MAG TPA: HD domain-containing protein [Patescibacteria group bacterium]|nr:HD domain-containing protein [Patescibacteria group bacterium]